MRIRLLNCLAGAVVKHGVKFLFSLAPGGDVVYEIAAEAWKDYCAGEKADAGRTELEALAQASAEDLRRLIREAVEEAAGGQPTATQDAVGAYLAQVPAAIRRSLRRPSDPSGRSVPATVGLRGPDDLAAFLPTRMPRFKAGDRPLAGVDWELEELIGVGGFGEVWKARHPYLKSKPPVALKFCLDDAATAALRNEAGVLDRVMQQGRHAGIVPLLHTYLSAEPPCLEYEFVEGGDLTGLIQEMHARGKVKPAVANRLLVRLAEIVAFAHKANPPIVHGDLKPANVLVRRTADGKVMLRIIDFGIGGLAAARAMQETRQPTRSRPALLTEAVRGAHTPLYASPEQMARRPGEPADPRDDVHALGVIWYQLITGDLGMMSIPSDWREQLGERGVDEELIRLLGSCIAPKADKRPADAAAVVEAVKLTNIPMIELIDTDATATKPAKPREAASRVQRPTARPEPASTRPADTKRPRATGQTKRPVESAPPRSRPLRRLGCLGGAIGALVVLAVVGVVILWSLLQAHWAVDLEQAKVGKDKAIGDKRSPDAPPTKLDPPAPIAKQPVTKEPDKANPKKEPMPVKKEPEPVKKEPEPVLVKPPDVAVAFAPKEEVDLGGGLKLKLVRIDPGSFAMGSPATEKERVADSEWQHEVEITQPYCMGIYEVTQAQFRRIMGKDTSSIAGLNMSSYAGLNTDDFPVHAVSWSAAMEFCTKASTLPAVRGNGWQVDLPTEAEWEYACRAGTSTVFHYGDNLDFSLANFDSYKPYGVDRVGPNPRRTTAVGTFVPNAWGLFDMHGNVAEWCKDWYSATYYKRGENKDPQGPETGEDRVLRGGAWDSPGRWCRSAYRGHSRYGVSQNGFRVVLRVMPGVTAPIVAVTKPPKKIVPPAPVMRAGLAIELTPMPKRYADKWKVPSKSQPQVAVVHDGGGGEKLGLQCDDVLVRINARDVLTPGQAEAALHALKKGETVELVILRYGKQRVLTGPNETAFAEADEWPRLLALAADDALAAAIVGRRYSLGTGVARNDAEAVKWFRKAAEKGIPLGQNGLGYHYDEGRGLPKSEADALNWYRKAAAQDYAFAQSNVGWMYENGLGVTKDLKEAIKWYKKAAEQENGIALASLGRLSTSDAEAVRWFKRAAVVDNPVGQSWLAQMYEEARGGLAQNIPEAVRLYRLAAAQGNQFAKQRLQVLGK